MLDTVRPIIVGTVEGGKRVKGRMGNPLLPSHTYLPSPNTPPSLPSFTLLPQQLDVSYLSTKGASASFTIFTEAASAHPTLLRSPALPFAIFAEEGEAPPQRQDHYLERERERECLMAPLNFYILNLLNRNPIHTPAITPKGPLCLSACPSSL